LCGQEKATKEKATPGSAVSGHPALRLRERAPAVRWQHLRVLTANWRASCAPPCGLFPAHARRATGGPVRAASCRRSNGHSSPDLRRGNDLCKAVQGCTGSWIQGAVRGAEKRRAVRFARCESNHRGGC